MAIALTMRNVDLYFPLPSDPAQLTRKLALKCATHPEVLVNAYARLAAAHASPFPAQQHLTHPAAVLEKGVSHAS